MIKQISELYYTTFGDHPIEVLALRAHASERKIYRLKGGGKTVCGVYNPYPAENRTFVYFSGVFRRLNLPVPSVFAVSQDDLVYLLEDLGDVTLYDTLLDSRTSRDTFPESVELLYGKVLSILPRFQVDAVSHIDFDRCYQASEFGEASMLADMEYFLASFLSKTGIDFDLSLLREDFATFTMYAMEAPRNYFLYRDFQARNVMVRGQDPFFIDYQGGRRGALQYDVASILYQSSAQIPDAARNRLCGQYLTALEAIAPAYGKDTFLKYLDRFVMLRMMQVLGTYGKQGLEKGKDYFANSIPPAVATLYGVARQDAVIQRLPELAKILDKLICHEQFGTKAAR